MLITFAVTAGRIRTGVLDNFMNINYLRNFYVSRVTYLTTARSAPGSVAKVTYMYFPEGCIDNTYNYTLPT
jgi:hypothetical protein